MTELTLPTCAHCGEPVPPEAPGGNCPRCLLVVGLGMVPDVPDQEPPPTGDVLPQLGDYELFEELGRGGMGIVWRARQRSLGRIVAVKRLLFAQFAHESVRRRFHAEAAAAAALRHPNIVAIHEVGEAEGGPFFSMDYIPGHNLAEVLQREAVIEPRRAARWLRTVAEAVQYAHDQGVIHRDLKPSNILLDATDQPHLSDFGLAVKLDAKLNITLSGQVLGSPNYLPPELAAGHKTEPSVAADLYSLGAILYHLLTGRPPFMAESVEATLLQVTQHEPVALRAINPTIPNDLESICLKCLSKEPTRRYRSAAELAEDLERFLAGTPTVARPVSRLEMLWRWSLREPKLATALAGVGILVILIALMPILYAARLRERLRDSLVAQTKAVRLGGRAGRRFETLELVRKATALKPTAEELVALRGETLQALLLSDVRQLPWSPRNKITNALYCFSRGSPLYAVAYPDGFVSVMEISNHTSLCGWYSPGKPQLPFALNESGSHLVLGGENGNTVWDVKKKTAVFKSLAPLAVSPSGRSVATWEPGEVVVAELPSGHRVAGYTVKGSPMPALVPRLFGCELQFSPNERYLAFSRRDEDSEFIIIDQLNQETTPLVQSHSNIVTAGFFYEAMSLRCAWHPSSESLAISTGNGVQVYGVNGGLKSEFERPTRSLAYSRDGNALVAHNLVELFIATGSATETQAGVPMQNGDFFQSSTSDSRLRVLDFAQKSPRLLDFASETCFHRIPFSEFWKRQDEPICQNQLVDAFSPNGEILAWMTEIRGTVVRHDLSFETNSRPVKLHLTDLRSQAEIAQFTIDTLDYLWFDAASRYFFLQSHNGLQRWPLQSTERGKKLGPPTLLSTLNLSGAIRAAAGEIAIVVKQDATETLQTHVVDLLTGRDTKVSEGVLPTLSYDGAWFIGFSRKRQFELWSTQNPRLVKSWPIGRLHGAGSLTPRFSPDSRWLGLVLGDGLLLFDTQTSQQKLIPYPTALRDTDVAGLTFSPDAKELIIAFSPWDLVLISVPHATVLAQFGLPMPLLKFPCSLAYDENGNRVRLVSDRVLATWDRGESLATLRELGIAW